MGVARTAVSAFVLRRTYSLSLSRLPFVARCSKPYSGYPARPIVSKTEEKLREREPPETYRGSNEGPKPKRERERACEYRRIYETARVLFSRLLRADDRQLLHRDCVTWCRGPHVIVLLASMSCVRSPFPSFFFFLLRSVNRFHLGCGGNMRMRHEKRTRFHELSLAFIVYL